MMGREGRSEVWRRARSEEVRWVVLGEEAPGGLCPAALAAALAVVVGAAALLVDHREDVLGEPLLALETLHVRLVLHHHLEELLK